MSVINNTSFNSDLIPGLVKKWFSAAMLTLDPLYSRMMTVEQSDRAYDVDATFTGMGSLIRKSQSGPLSNDTASQAFTPRYLHVSYALGFAITKEALRDGNAFADAKRFTEMLARGAGVTKEIVAANIINFAGTSGYTMDGGDGVILASASHPTRSGNQSNILSGGTDLSEAALEALDIQIQNAKDNRGLRIKLAMDKLIIAPDLKATAHRILQSDMQVNSAEHNRNYLKDLNVVNEVVVNPYLTSSTQWQVTTNVQDGLKFKVRQEAEMDEDNDFNTKNGLHSVDMRISAGWSDFRGLYISL